MHRVWLVLALAAAAFAQDPIHPDQIRGFPPDALKSQRELEDRAKALVQAPRLHIYMERMASKPHHAGSAGSKAVADYLLAQLKEWGLDSRMEDFEALLPYPASRTLEMTAPVRYRAQLKEPVLPEDTDSAQPDQLATFNAYSASGDVTAPLVYVNFGLPNDYEHLKRLGIDVKGKIVIARYGKSWRGVKAKLAQDNGAVGCIIYSDPREDGYFQNDVYPKGPMRPEQGVQRGSVLDMSLYPGDPLSPGWASEPGSKRLALADAKSLLKIPVLPLSYGDARPLLEQLAGPVAPEPWRGALPITYHVGPGPATLHLKLDFDWSTRPLHDVIATVPGSLYPNQWVVYGNHHDAWVNGAADPASGAAALLETARVLAALRQQGWQPKRTIVLALWDGEEFGLMGSTEWAEKHLDELRRNAVVYINSDLNGRGALNAAGSHSLETFVGEVLRDIPEPNSRQDSERSLLEAARVRRNRGNPEAPPEFRLSALGSGSDYVPFLDHAGIATLNFGFGSADSGGVYHSIYDTLGWFDRFSDADLSYGKALSQILLTSILRLSETPVLPFDFEALARTIRAYTDEVQRDARRRSGNLDIRQLQTQIARMEGAARAYNESIDRAADRAPGLSQESLQKLNEALAHAERSLLLPDGLPGRPWYKHALYAPGVYTGYDAKTLPGIRESVDAQHWDLANQQAKRAAQAIKSLAAEIEEATRLLKE